MLNSDHLGTVSLSQSFATTVNQTYVLTFALNNENSLGAGSKHERFGSGFGGSGNGDAYYNPIYGYGSTILNPADLATQVSVSVGNVTNQMFGQTTAGWNVETLSFKATSNLTTLTFTDTTPGPPPDSNIYSSPLIDAVVVTPEPGFYGALALGMSGLVSARAASRA